MLKFIFLNVKKLQILKQRTGLGQLAIANIARGTNKKTSRPIVRNRILQAMGSPRHRLDDRRQLTQRRDCMQHDRTA